MTWQLIQAVIVLVTLVGVALGRYPWLKMNRATIALVGATALVALGALSLEEAFEAIGLDTLLLIFAMMVINANLRFSGFFNLVVAKVSVFGHSPQRLLMLVVIYLPWRDWRRYQSGPPADNPRLLHDTEKDRRPLVAFITMLLNSLLFLFVITTLVPVFSLNPCA